MIKPVFVRGWLIEYWKSLLKDNLAIYMKLLKSFQVFFTFSIIFEVEIIKAGCKDDHHNIIIV